MLPWRTEVSCPWSKDVSWVFTTPDPNSLGVSHTLFGGPLSVSAPERTPVLHMATKQCFPRDPAMSKLLSGGVHFCR